MKSLKPWGLIWLVLALCACAGGGPPQADEVLSGLSGGARELGTEALYEEVDEEEEAAEFAEYEDSNFEPYALLGAVLTPERIIEEGGLLVEDGFIQEVWEGDPPDSIDGVTTISTGGLILPGLIDLHNHVAYNFLPLWESGVVWPNRYAWQRASAYQKAVSEPYGAAKKAKLMDEMVKYGEIRGLVGGTTSILGAKPTRGAGILARNIDQRTLGEDLVRTNVGWAEEFGCNRGSPRCPEQPEKVEDLRQAFAEGDFRAMIFHLAEGTDDSSREEFRWLEETGLLVPEVVVTHGTALGRDELRKMGQAGMSLIWSPRSNLELYGATTDVRTARREGVRVALAPDWSPSGSDNLLAELRFAWAFNQEELEGFFSAREMVEMATSIPAAIAGREQELGRIAPGFVADLVVLERRRADPWESVLASDERHVRLVTVNGVALYGYRSWLNRLEKEGDWERIYMDGRLRALDATAPEGSEVPNGEQTFSAIRGALEEAYQPFGRLPRLTANRP